MNYLKLPADPMCTCGHPASHHARIEGGDPECFHVEPDYWENGKPCWIHPGNQPCSCKQFQIAQ